MVTWPPSQAPLASTGPFSYSSRLVFTLHCSGPAAPPSQVCAALAEETRALGCSHSPGRNPDSPGGCSSPGRWRQGGSGNLKRCGVARQRGQRLPRRRADVLRPWSGLLPLQPPTPPPSTAHEFAARTLQVEPRDPAATEHNPRCWHRQELSPPNSARSHAQPTRPKGLGHSSHSHQGALSTQRHLPARSRPPSRKAK